MFVSSLNLNICFLAIIGIIFGIVILLISIGIVLFLKFFLKRKKRLSKERIERRVNGDNYSNVPSVQESKNLHYAAIPARREPQQDENSGTQFQ
jgi:hypothetical protein